jgi:TrmH family RNA methyltransferase
MLSENAVLLKGVKYSTNIGSSARALANMGWKQLILIEPQCEVDQKSYHSAAGAQSVLDNVQKFRTWKEYLQFYKSPVRIAFTARSGANRTLFPWRDFLISTDLGQTLLNSQSPIHLVFGPEDHGLSDQDLHHCNFKCNLETFGEMKSLNLSQAVLLALYDLEIHKKGAVNSKMNDTENSIEYSPKKFSAKDSFQFLDLELLNKWLLAMGFKLESPKINAFSVLSKFFSRSPMNTKEKDLLEKAMAQSLYKLRSESVSK